MGNSWPIFVKIPDPRRLEFFGDESRDIETVSRVPRGMERRDLDSGGRDIPLWNNLWLSLIWASIISSSVLSSSSSPMCEMSKSEAWLKKQVFNTKHLIIQPQYFTIYLPCFFIFWLDRYFFLKLVTDMNKIFNKGKVSKSAEFSTL